jgi:hypothetical protein
LLAAGFLAAGSCLLIVAIAFAALGIQPSVQALAVIGVIAVVLGLVDWLRNRRRTAA